MTRPRMGLQLLERAPEVEAALWRRLRDEKDAACRERLFDHYVALAKTIARGEFRRRPAYGLERADFEQLAFGGLLEAIDKFDPLNGAPFEAFARVRIKGVIADGAMRSSEAAAQYSARRRLEQERLKSLLSRDSSADADAIAQLAELASAIAIGLIAENARLSAAQEAPLDAYESLAWREMQIKVVEEIGRLGGAEGTVMQQHYMNDVPFTEIAKLLGVTKGRVAQIHRAALMRLRLRLTRES